MGCWFVLEDIKINLILLRILLIFVDLVIIMKYFVLYGLIFIEWIKRRGFDIEGIKGKGYINGDFLYNEFVLV